MSGQLSTVEPLPIYRLSVAPRVPALPSAWLDQLPSLGIAQDIQLKISSIYFIEGEVDALDLDRLSSLICDPVTETVELTRLFEDRVASINGVLEVALRPGVTDNTAVELLHAARRLGIHSIRSAATGQRYAFSGDLSTADLDRIARMLIVNSTIQVYSLGEIMPGFLHPAPATSGLELIPIRGLSDSGLMDLSAKRRLALDLAEMQAVQGYFEDLNRDATDAELETIAQTWSEHCYHKTFKARIEVEDQNSQRSYSIDGLLKTCLRAATQQIGAPWLRSAFVDNAGVIAFDDQFDLSFKVETHNHPSAIEPFGGANTGIGGVVRDILGVSHRPIANTDVLCFGPTDLEVGHASSLPSGVLHPARIQAGVVAGVEDYGNKLGLPTVNGAVLYHPDYTANPLVYCGCVGIGPVGAHRSQPKAGDRIVLIGGKTGRDGLRGATFSSLTMDAQTGQVAGSSVQIGDPITEKGVMEVVVRTRDAGLYNAITDCGAGGLSSAVGEMSAEVGARVDLLQVPLKYAGLLPWEIWLSEAQERMVLAVPEENLAALAEICKTYWVEWSDIGEFIDSGRLQVVSGEWIVLDLENEFLHHGCPRQVLPARIPVQGEQSQGSVASRNDGPGFSMDKLKAGKLLLQLLADPNLASKEQIIRRYDHEVRGATIIKPLVGEYGDGPSDAAVLKPLETQGWQGFVLANGINPWIGLHDAHAMAVSAVDEAIRNAVATGADPERLCLLDNFCWGDPRRPETLGSLVQAAQGCYSAALHYRTPFISGKDSLNNEFLGMDGKRHAIPGTLLISSIAIHPDIQQAVSMDIKRENSTIYLVGEWSPALAGAQAPRLAPGIFDGLPALQIAPGLPEHAPAIYQQLHAAMQAGLVLSAHDLSEGGLAVSAAEMCIAGRMGMELDLSDLDQDARLALFAETNGCLLVEIAPQFRLAFEAAFQRSEGMRACLPLGNTGGEKLIIQHAGRMILEAGVGQLVDSFTSLARNQQKF